MELQGIDVSTWQGSIDWKKVNDAGIQFAILRATFGTDGVDNRFLENAKNAGAAGVPMGAYHYSYAKSEDEARTEARHFLSTIAPYQFDYPVAFDIENNSLTGLGKDKLTDIVLAFFEVVENAKYYPCLYSNLNWLKNYLDLSRINKHYDIWLAQWNDNPTFEGDFGLWQYTSEGNVAGISGNVDRDIAYKDYPKLMKEKGLNGYGSSKPDPDPEPTPGPSGFIYQVKSGDTMSGIAQKFSINLSDLLKANPQIKNPDLIYSGQSIHIPAAGSSPSPKPDVKTYTVKSGDTMSSIAQKFSVSLSALIKSNPQIKDPDVIHTGDVLKLPSGSSASVKPVQKTYTVQDGDTMSSIAQKFSVGLSALIKANPQIKNPDVIHTNDVLTIPIS